MRFLVPLVFALGAAAAPSCTANLDPPDTLRNGDDFLSYPMPATATAADCIALCCQTSTCVALSYNNPQPEYASIGGTACPVGGVCCMLKGSVPSLNASNPYPPGTVRSAALTVPVSAPAPTPPFPPSMAISSAVLVGPRSTWCDGRACGDTWPVSVWARSRPVGQRVLRGGPPAHPRPRSRR